MFEKVKILQERIMPSGGQILREESLRLKPSSNASKVDIQLNIEVPEDAELVEPLQEGCVWRQARGQATEVSGAESEEAFTEKRLSSLQLYI